jgi:hypothetical protein
MVSPVVGCTIGDAKCAQFGTLSAYVMGTYVRGVKANVGVSASCIVITLSACWLINLALACVPPPSNLYGGIIITGVVVVFTLFNRRWCWTCIREYQCKCYAFNCRYRSWCIILCDPLVSACIIYQVSLGRWVTRFHDRRGIGNSFYWRTVLLFALWFHLTNVIVHPLFTHSRWR